MINLRVSLNVTNYSWPTGPAGLGAELARVVGAAEDAGLDTVWVSDHLLQADPTATPDAEMLEAYTTRRAARPLRRTLRGPWPRSHRARRGHHVRPLDAGHRHDPRRRRPGGPAAGQVRQPTDLERETLTMTTDGNRDEILHLVRRWAEAGPPSR